MKYDQELYLELNSNTAYSTVGAKQGDSGSRSIKVHVLENGTDYDLQGVTSAYFRLRKPDGKAVINTCDINREDNTITFFLSAQSLAAAGRGYADITLMSGSQILSTVSFILLIMASPAVAEQATSSNEFGFLNAVVEDATHTIYDAQAWAEGKRGTTDVYGENGFDKSYISAIINTLTVTEETFKQQVGERPGLKRDFTFSYSGNNVWNLVIDTYEGNTKTTSDPTAIGDINGYGITYGLISGADEPNINDKIIVIIKEADPAFNNNAKYYSEAAKESKEAIDNLTATGEKIFANDFNEEKAYQIGDYVWYPPHTQSSESLLYRFIINHIEDTPWNASEVVEELLIEKTTVDDITNFHFKIPQGPVGNVSFMTFDLNADTGELIMYTPDYMSPQVGFKLDNNDGNLYVEILNGGGS